MKTQKEINTIYEVEFQAMSEELVDIYVEER